jgi:hypothetical protein
VPDDWVGVETEVDDVSEGWVGGETDVIVDNGCGEEADELR